MSTKFLHFDEFFLDKITRVFDLSLHMYILLTCGGRQPGGPGGVFEARLTAVILENTPDTPLCVKIAMLPCV